MSTIRATVIGAGLAGLSAASYLHRNGLHVTVLESSDRVGGVVTTDHVDGFFLDRGFQILLDSYPEVKRIVNTENLSLKRFTKGFDLIGPNFKTTPVRDPRKQFNLDTILRMVRLISPKDTVAVIRLLSKIARSDRDHFSEARSEDTYRYLFGLGVTKRTIKIVFEPFLQAVFLDERLQTPSSMLLFTLSNFLHGNACIPETGIAELPSQIAATIPTDRIRLKSEVASLNDHNAVLESGEVVEHDFIVVATKPNSISNLTNTQDHFSYRGAGSHYFATEAEIPSGPRVKITSYPESQIATAVAIDQVSPSYAPKGVHLISVSTLDHTEDLSAIKDEVGDIFNLNSSDLNHVKSYWIDRALPASFGADHRGAHNSAQISTRIFRAGDFVENPSINGAIASGRKAAELILRQSLEL